MQSPHILHDKMLLLVSASAVTLHTIGEKVRNLTVVFYHLRMQRGNAFSCVCLSECLSCFGS